ncbi:tetratricopeptide repeat protein [Kaustia mangrovi]|uniref:Tetratricopeptide repeat protein n=1 Tax=Kaustia mangrovi TaxID=2593653 RepID=A0A7S8C198_9HYPH|nr:tetratricopeptide repeat protein [Kaustia mangrovi]QPC41528.1 tetratricopeptide repeat protein [Kaustia mangrovi]
MTESIRSRRNEAEEKMRAGDWLGAFALWEELRQRLPGSPMPYILGAKALINYGDLDGGEVAITRALRRFPKDAAALVIGAGLSCQRGEWPQALARWTRLCRIAPEKPVGYSGAVNALLRLGDLDRAQTLNAEAIGRFPADVTFRIAEARIATQRGDFDAASSAWARVLAMAPDNPAGYDGWVEMLMTREKPDKAAQVLDDAVMRFPDNLDFRMKTAEFAMRRGDWTAAAHGWAELRKRFPRHLPGYLRGADALMRAGRLTDAAELLCDYIDSGGDGLKHVYVKAADLAALVADEDLSRQAAIERLLLHLFHQPIASYAEAEMPALAVQVQKMVFQTGSEPEPVRKQIERVWRAAGYHRRIPSEEVYRVGLGLGLLDYRLAIAETHRLVRQFDFATLRHIFSVLPWHTLNRNSLEGYAAALLEDYARRDELGPAQRQALEILLSACRFDLFRALRRSDQRQASPVAPAILQVPSRLKIAICVSGQLRGYVEALRTWRHLGLERHEAHYFVHSWYEIGRKRPNIMHANRVFGGRFLKTYMKVCQEYGPQRVGKGFPVLLGSFDRMGRVSERDIMDIYDTPHVRLEDDSMEPFSSFSNSKKMYYKIEKAWEMAHDTGVDYDLVIRIRPDLEIAEGPRSTGNPSVGTVTPSGSWSPTAHSSCIRSAA